MALKFQIDKLEDVAAPLREHYAAKDGKFQLTLVDKHPDSVRVEEFRDTNITLNKKLAAFDGIDPAAVAADRAKLTELENAKPNERITALEAELAAEKSARAALQTTSDASTLRALVSDAFLKSGGRPSATDFIVDKAKALFTVENGALVGKNFDPLRPGEKLSVGSFITLQVKESDFAFLPSGGAGASPLKSAGAATTGAKELRNPTAQQLGQHGDAIRRGDLRVVYDEK